MAIETTVKIGTDTVDLTQPCDVATALRKVQLKLTSGGMRQTVRIDGEEVTFTTPNDKRLAGLIATYDGLCAKSGATNTRTRYAKRVRFTG
ncbi:MAG: hypothetical protein R3D59_18170 [Paracoccaceae bacterium]